MVPALAKRTMLFTAIWLVLTGAAPDALAFGLPAIAAAVWLSLRLLPPVGPWRILKVLALLPGFLAGSLAGGIAVARRAFRLRPALHPGWVQYPTGLKGGARLVLGAEMSLMPGTLVAGYDAERLLVHVLDLRTDFAQQIAREERRIAGASGQDR